MLMDLTDSPDVTRCGRPVRPGSNWDGWCDTPVGLGARKWTGINQSLGRPAGHQGDQGWQRSGPEWCTEQGPENPSTR